MSDPDRHGPYTCCGQTMRPITALIDGETVIAFLCPCGVWRHALPSADQRRVHVDAYMRALVNA